MCRPYRRGVDESKQSGEEGTAEKKVEEVVGRRGEGRRVGRRVLSLLSP